jgi:hypothetical protein
VFLWQIVIFESGEFERGLLNVDFLCLTCFDYSVSSA